MTVKLPSDNGAIYYEMEEGGKNTSNYETHCTKYSTPRLKITLNVGNLDPEWQRLCKALCSRSVHTHGQYQGFTVNHKTFCCHGNVNN